MTSPLVALLVLATTDSGAAPAPSTAAPAITLQPHALLQLQYLGIAQQGQPVLAESGVSLRRARFSVEGFAYTPRLGYRAEVELGQGAVAPLDLYVDFRPTARWSIRAGQLRVPFSRSWTITEERLAFPERSIATEEFRYDHDIGALATVSFLDGKLEASAGAFNGAGPNVVRNDNVDPVLIARISGLIGSPTPEEEGDFGRVRPPSLKLGAAATLDYVPVPAAYGFSSGEPLGPIVIVDRDTDRNGRPDGVRVTQLEVDVALRWRGAALDGEAYYRREAWDAIGARQPPASLFLPHDAYGGFFAQATYFILPARLQAGARVSVTELSPLAIGGRHRPDTTCVSPDGLTVPCALPFTNRRSELSFVAVAHAFRHGVQLAAMYSLLLWRTDQQALLPWSREQHFVLQGQLAF